MLRRLLLFVVLCIVCHPLSGQEDVVINTFPYIEDFESVIPPELPPGWAASTNRSEDGDFITELFQGSNRLSSVNATIEQFVSTPVFDFSGRRPVSISFDERRSGTYGAVIRLNGIIGGVDTLIVGETQLTDPNTFVPVSFDLPLELMNEPHVRFEFRVIPDSAGAAGTLRFDNVRVEASVQYTHDLRLNAVHVVPPLPTSGDSLHVTVSVLNAGLEPASGFIVGIQTAGQQTLAEKYISGIIAPDDSTKFQLSTDPLFQDIHPLEAYVEYEPNEGSQTSLIFEVHTTDPVVSYPWHEQFDYPGDTLPLQWRTSFFDGQPDASLTSSIVHSGERAVIMSNATREQFLILPPFDTSDGVLYDITFYERRTGTFDATVYVDISTDRGGQFQEYASFTHSGETNYVERSIMPDESLSAGDIFYMRLRPAGDGTGTTGTIRFDSFTATARFDHDIAITGMEIEPPLPLPGDEIEVHVTVGNPGLEPAHGFSVNLFRQWDDTDDDFVLIGSHDYPGQLEPSGVVTIVFAVDDMPAGYSLLRAVAEYPPDGRSDNNVFDKEIFIRYPEGTLIVNEILYHPREGQTEFVEIYNPGERAVDLLHWSVRDRETPGGQINRYMLSDTSLFIEPESFAVLAADSSLFDWFGLDGTGAIFVIAGRTALGLSSLGDEVMLLDPSDSVVDSVAYQPSWHHPDVFETRGRSLERISPHIESDNPANWSTSADPLGGTPGRHNSIYTDTPVVSASIEVHPNPFSPNADGFEDYTIITYNLPQQTAMVRLRIFDSMGRHIRTLLNNTPSGPEGRVIWDGRNDEGRVARLGIYVILLEAYDGSRGGVTQLKTVVVLADRL